MKRLHYIFLIVIIMVIGLQGCQPRVTSPASSPVGGHVSDAQAEISSVRVLQSDTPQQILAVVRAVVSNTCLRLGEATIQRQGMIFTVNVPVISVAAQGCQPGSLTQDLVIPLISEPLPQGNYIVLVNGVLSSFRVVRPVEAAPSASLPTVVSAAVAPTATPMVVPTKIPLATATATSISEVVTPLSPAVTATPIALAAGKDPSSCVNKAAFYGDLNVPNGTPFGPGGKFSKTWMVMNMGTCTWGTGYQLVFAGGDPLGAHQKIPLPQARPHEVVQISVDMTAPVVPQSYESDWAFETPDGFIFGLGNPAVTPLVAKISVVSQPVGLPSGLDCGALRLSDMEAQVLEQINTTRAEHGLYPLVLEEDISQVALKHSLEMACYDRVSHFGLDGMLYNVRLQRDGILFATSNEIIYSGNGGPKGSILWWMNSPIHRPIVLSTKYTKIGIGYIYYDKNPYKQRITVDFIHP